MAPSKVTILPNCSICQDEDGGLDYFVTLCGHVFHQGCINNWDQIGTRNGRPPRCPVCSGDLRFGSSRQNESHRHRYSSKFTKIHSLTQRIVDEPSEDDGISASTSKQPSESVSNLKKTIKDLKDQLEDQSKTVKRLKLEPESLRNESKMLKLEVLKYKNLYKSCREERIKEQVLLNERIKCEKRASETNRVMFGAEKQLLKKEIEDLNDKCQNAINENDQLNQQLVKFQQENKELQGFLSEFSEEKKQFEFVRKELENKLSDQSQHIRGLISAKSIFERKLEVAKCELVGKNGHKIRSDDGTNSLNMINPTMNNLKLPDFKDSNKKSLESIQPTNTKNRLKRKSLTNDQLKSSPSSSSSSSSSSSNFKQAKIIIKSEEDQRDLINLISPNSSPSSKSSKDPIKFSNVSKALLRESSEDGSRRSLNVIESFEQTKREKDKKFTVLKFEKSRSDENLVLPSLFGNDQLRSKPSKLNPNNKFTNRSIKLSNNQSSNNNLRGIHLSSNNNKIFKFKPYHKF